MTAYSRANKPPNNVLPPDEEGPPVVWNDAEVLRAAARAMFPPDATLPAEGTSAHARSIVRFFQGAGVAAPTEDAVLQWVRRSTIPDRWRPTLAYLLIKDRHLVLPAVFRRAPGAVLPTSGTASVGN